MESVCFTWQGFNLAGLYVKQEDSTHKLLLSAFIIQRKAYQTFIAKWKALHSIQEEMAAWAGEEGAGKAVWFMLGLKGVGSHRAGEGHAARIQVWATTIPHQQHLNQQKTGLEIIYLGTDCYQNLHFNTNNLINTSGDRTCGNQNLTEE